MLWESFHENDMIVAYFDVTLPGVCLEKMWGITKTSVRTAGDRANIQPGTFRIKVSIVTATPTG